MNLISPSKNKAFTVNMIRVTLRNNQMVRISRFRTVMGTPNFDTHFAAHVRAGTIISGYSSQFEGPCGNLISSPHFALRGPGVQAINSLKIGFRRLLPASARASQLNSRGHRMRPKLYILSTRRLSEVLRTAAKA